MVGTLFVVLSR